MLYWGSKHSKHEKKKIKKAFGKFKIQAEESYLLLSEFTTSAHKSP